MSSEDHSTKALVHILPSRYAGFASGCGEGERLTNTRFRFGIAITALGTPSGIGETTELLPRCP